jgi:hypothetical protein
MRKPIFFALFSFLFSKKEERIPVEGKILVKGKYEADGKPRPIFRFVYPQKNKNLPKQILINTYHLYYKWKGNIMFSGKAYKANFLIDADGPKSGGLGKTILLDTAKTECGRAWWKIENEHNNVLKNHGYNLKHNFGHGAEQACELYCLLSFQFHGILQLIDEG